MLTKDEHRATEKEEPRAAARRQVKRVRRLKINVAAWVPGIGSLRAVACARADGR